MLKKKNTVCLESEVDLLPRKMANTRNVTVAEAIRISIQKACRSQTPEKKAVWDDLDKIWAKAKDISSGRIERAVDQAVKKVRIAKKKRHFS